MAEPGGQPAADGLRPEPGHAGLSRGAGHVHDHDDGGALMERRIRWLGIVLLLCFVALFVQLNNIQIVKANALSNSPSNPRVIQVARNDPRGDILSADGVVLASSVPSPAATTSTSGPTTR